MPTLEHNGLVDVFRSNPRLAPHLVEELLHLPVPRYESVAVVESTLDQLLPSEFRADLVLEMRGAAGDLVLCIVLEVQRAGDGDKKFSWPVYLAVVRSRTRCPAIVLVVAPDARVASWAGEAIDLGLGLSSVRPLVLGPKVVPEVTDPAVAAVEPELAILSALAHGNGSNGFAVLMAAQKALDQLDPERSAVYLKIIFDVLNEPIKRAMVEWIMENRVTLTIPEEDLPPFMRQMLLRGRAEGELKGELKGKRDLLLHLVSLRGLVLTAEERARIDECTDGDTLQRWADNLFIGKTGADVFG
ncbi:MAG: hypothetical protein U0441_28645 [Polyangiaceae bacterium]